MSSQAVKACCGNIHLADTKRDRSLEIFVRDTTAAMKNQRNVHFLMDLLQYIKSKSRCYRIVTVCIADGNCKSIDTCLSCINNCIIRVCAADTMVTASILTSAYKTKLSLNGGAIFTGFLHNRLYLGDIFLKRKSGRIQHNGCKTKLQSLVNRLKSKAVIQMDSHIHLGFFCSLHHHRSHQMKRGILETNLRDLKDDGCI